VDDDGAGALVAAWLASRTPPRLYDCGRGNLDRSPSYLLADYTAARCAGAEGVPTT